MPDTIPAPTVAPSLPLVERIDVLMSRRPDLRKVAQQVLEDALQALHSGQRVDLNDTFVHIAPPTMGAPKPEPKRPWQLLAERCSRGVFQPLPDGSYLSNDDTRSFTLDDLEHAINEWGAHLLPCYQQKLIDYWCEESNGKSPWLSLSEWLEGEMHAQAQALVGPDRMTVDQVLECPDSYERESSLGGDTTVVDCVVSSVRDSVGVRAKVEGLLLTRVVDEQLCVVRFTARGGLEPIPAGKRRDRLLRRVQRVGSFGSPSHRPDGNVFDVWALTLLEKELQDITLVAVNQYSTAEALEERIKRLTALGSLTGRKVLALPKKVLPVMRRRTRLVHEWSSPRQRYSFRERECLEHLSPRTSRSRRSALSFALKAVNRFKENFKSGKFSFSNADTNTFSLFNNLNLNFGTQNCAPSRTSRSIESDDESLADYRPVLRNGPEHLLSKAERAINSGDALLTQREGKKKFLRKSAGIDPVGLATRSPADIEDLAGVDAKRYEDAASTIQQLTAGPGVFDTRDQVTKLKAAAQEFRLLGVSLRLEMTRNTLTPSIDGLVYLIEKGTVEIRKTGVRKASQFDGKPDYIQEYEVYDLEKKRPLWYAHFHYSSMDSSPTSFTKAHLKIAAQRTLGREYEEREKKEGRDVKIWRGEVNATAAQLYFLSV